MNKTAIKNFAVWARRKLIDDISYKAGLLGVTEKGIAEPLPQSTRDMQMFDIGTKEPVKVTGVAMEQRSMLVAAIKSKARESNLKSAFQFVIEEVAYTWFNRLIAIRFMEVNDYLPSRTRVLSSENPAKAEPDFVTNPFDTDLSFTAAQQDEVMRLKDTNKLDELFRMLFIMQCNKLHEILPRLFETVSDYTELLLTISFTDRDGVVYHLTHDIPEDDFNVDNNGQIEIIGWMYQYYNTEAKEKVFADLKKNIKISKENIPAATQLFTPDWIVRYMVENSLGRLWVEGHEDFDKSQWKYYLEEAQQEPEVAAKLAELREERKSLRPEEIRCIDPCMGSGHILVYMFDVLTQIYTSQGYIERDAASLILQNNLYGLDIDDRAAQLAYFAVMMKARQYDRRFFSRNVQPHIYAVPETEGKLSACSHEFGLGEQLYSAFHDGKEYGSLLDIGMGEAELNLLKMHIDDMLLSGDFTDLAAANVVAPLWDVAMALTQKYDAVITNPPYMGASGMNDVLCKFVKEYYPDSKSDASTCFMERSIKMCKEIGYMAMINIPVWMFLSSYEKLRNNMIMQNTFINMVHPGRGIFGSDFGTTTFVIGKQYIKGYKGSYRRLFDKQGEVEGIEERERAFLSGKGSYTARQDNFAKIPGAPVAYWVSGRVLDVFVNNKSIGDISLPRQGLITGDNDRFLRLWFEVSTMKSWIQKTNVKWFPINKGGEARRWYGNQEYVVNWENDGFEIQNFKDEKGKLRSRPQNLNFNFKEAVSWSLVTSGGFTARYYPSVFMFNVAGISCFPQESQIMYILALLNTKIITEITQIINPTINMNAGDIAKIPVAFSQDSTVNITELSEICIELCKLDWDSFETSWDFQEHPFIRWSKGLWDCTCTAATLDSFYGHHVEWPKSNLELCWLLWQGECQERFNQLKANEEELNRIFIDIYGLQDELTPEVEDKDVTVRRADLGRDVRSFISYAVGCMFGRYSLDVPGLVLAGQKYEDRFVRNPQGYQYGEPVTLAGDYVRKSDGESELSICHYVPDADNCIPITDEEYFDDDIVSRFVEFVRVAFGEEMLEANLDFIASALGNKGNTSREVIRNYFLNDFFKDHVKTYQKRPIYWLFDSGKQNGFKALVYMHRWDADTVGNLRVEYLHRMQRVYEKEIERMQETIDNSKNGKEVAAAQKRKDKLTKQMKETKEYDAKVAHIALRRIDIDLDDGVKVNYDKVQTDTEGKNLGILSAIK